MAPVLSPTTSAKSGAEDPQREVSTLSQLGCLECLMWFPLSFAVVLAWAGVREALKPSHTDHVYALLCLLLAKARAFAGQG